MQVLRLEMESLAAFLSWQDWAGFDLGGQVGPAPSFLPQHTNTPMQGNNKLVKHRIIWKAAQDPSLCSGQWLFVKFCELCDRKKLLVRLRTDKIATKGRRRKLPVRGGQVTLGRDNRRN